MPFEPPFHAKTKLGYCTNVHSGTDLATIKARLDEFAVPLARKTNAGESLGVGLWLPSSAATELASHDQAQAFGRWLAERNLDPFTINGFPFDNFHLPVVKHAVYRPTWADVRRLEYTVRLARILAALRNVRKTDGESPVASISTLPVGWPGVNDEIELAEAGRHLRILADELEVIENQTGVLITVAIEPEPGCLLDRCGDVIEFFQRQLPEVNHRRYLSVCHDICHSAVMYEDQADVLRRYAQAGISVGKVQVSSAIDVPLGEMSDEHRRAAVEQLREFAEDRYLHQTGCVGADSGFRLVEDLPKWLADPHKLDDQSIRIHFHVPIFLERFGHLWTTRREIAKCVAAMRAADAPRFTGHWEVETYAWTVMPSEMRASGLTNDIEKELLWFNDLLRSQVT